MVSNPPIAKTTRPRGRPKRGTGPAIDWAAVETLLIHGQTTQDSLGREQRTYPSLRELARRYGVSVSLIATFATKHRCAERRKEMSGTQPPSTTKQLIDDIEKDLSRGVALEDMLVIINRFLLAFRRDLVSGRVRTDSVSDFERLFKMREMINSTLQQRGQETDQLSLVSVQRRQRELYVQREAMRPEFTGVIASAREAGQREATQPELTGATAPAREAVEAARETDGGPAR